VGEETGSSSRPWLLVPSGLALGLALAGCAERSGPSAPAGHGHPTPAIHKADPDPETVRLILEENKVPLWTWSFEGSPVRFRVRAEDLPGGSGEPEGRDVITGDTGDLAEGTLSLWMTLPARGDHHLGVKTRAGRGKTGKSGSASVPVGAWSDPGAPRTYEMGQVDELVVMDTPEEIEVFSFETPAAGAADPGNAPKPPSFRLSVLVRATKPAAGAGKAAN
jgi:hypothetical protein